MLASSGIMHRTAKANENGIRRCWIRVAYLHKRPPRLIPHPILSQRIHVIRVQTYTYTRIYIDAAGGRVLSRFAPKQSKGKTTRMTVSSIHCWLIPHLYNNNYYYEYRLRPFRRQPPNPRSTRYVRPQRPAAGRSFLLFLLPHLSKENIHVVF